uniref:DRBM domain-containing protein n=2 Tax=Chloropicon primus TaxID=1764295 RepID=A0A7S2T3M8_9CHLO|mmetsp:Transcript_5589/g.16996  ORF Transcript_5589/g.16996 Transcript_5589/m.16996 type:complete len:328 (+) Transcript_5589:160-1143(+)
MTGRVADDLKGHSRYSLPLTQSCSAAPGMFQNFGRRGTGRAVHGALVAAREARCCVVRRGNLGARGKHRARARPLHSRGVRASAAGGRGEESNRVDAMGALQLMNEMAQKDGVAPPAYTLIEHSGPSHAPLFRYAVNFQGRVAEGLGQLPKKRLAQEAAASVWLYGPGGAATENTVIENEGKKRKNEKRSVALSESGTLCMIDLDNMPQTLEALEEYMVERGDHGVCEVRGYSSKAYNPGRPLPNFVDHRRAHSMDRDAADILMVFEAGVMAKDIGSPGSRVKSVVLVSKDHFAGRLQEILQASGVNTHHVCNYLDLKSVLQMASRE